MRTILGLFVLLVVLGTGASAQQQAPEFPKLKGPYLGQKAPGMTPEVFAPGIISTEAHEFSCSFTPDGNEFYFTRRDPTTKTPLIMVTKLVDGAWTKPEVVPFIDNTQSFEPRVTADGKRLYFTFGKIIPGQQGPPMNIFYVERQGTNWGAAQTAGPTFNPMKAMYVSTTRDGTIYTTDVSGGPGSESIAVAKPVEGKYEKLERLGPPINVGAQDMYPFVAPDESYLLFNSKRPVEGIDSGLFISFRGQDGAWSAPKAVDVGLNVGLPLVTPDGKFLFFTAGERGKSDIYWVDAKILDELRPK
jgi:Tol biopolymer transport system component